MENIIIEGTIKTPKINFDSNGKFKIEGRAIPEDAAKFFTDPLNWVIDYCKNPQQATIVDIELEYFNSGASKYVLQMLKELMNVEDVGKTLEINWYYEEGDDDILERGEYFASILDKEINFVEFD